MATTGPVYLDGRTARLFEYLQSNEPAVIGRVCAALDVFCAPGIIGMALGISEKSARRLIDRGSLPSVSHGRIRWVRLSQLINNKNGKGTHRHDQGNRPRAAD